jgi:hypothetical protein
VGGRNQKSSAAPKEPILIGKRCNGTRQPIRQSARHDAGKDVIERAVVPAGSVSAAVETIPQVIAQNPVVEQDRFSVMGLVGQRYQQRSLGFIRQRG